MNGAEADQYFCGATRDVTLIQYGKAQGMHAGYLGASSRGGGAVEDAAGGLWFASKSGLVGVDARELLNSRPPRVVIESVLLNGSPAPDWLFPGGSTLQIPAGARSIIFRYTALTYVSPHIVAYKYRLRGLDTDWIPAGNNREARFTTLPPGDYELEVAARNAGGMWSDEVARVRFTQEPFFYQTRAFSILAWLGGTLLTAVIVGLATAALHAISVRKMRRKVELLEAQQALLRERARIARDIHDDVGSTLTRIVLLSELATREPSQTYGPEGHLEGIRSAAREITRRLDEIVWAVNPRNDTLEALATYICKYVSDQARAAGLQCRLELPEVVPVWPLSGVTRHNIFLAVKEAVHNAVKHASARQIHLRLALQEKSITLEIADDGGGFADVGGEAEGDGLRNMRMRMTNLGGPVRNPERSGTRHHRVAWDCPTPRTANTCPPNRRLALMAKNPKNPPVEAQLDQLSATEAREKSGTIGVTLVEDDKKLLAALSQLIGCDPQFEVLAGFLNAPSALREIPRLQPDIVIMDINLPGVDGIECTRQLKSIMPQCQILMLTVYEDTDAIFRALRAGASGYLLKQTPIEELLAALREISRGGSPMSSHVARKVVQSFKEGSNSSSDMDSLSPREREVLQLIAEGCLFKEIADKLGVSFGTIHTYCRRIYEKLHVRSRAQAVAKLHQR